MGEGCELWGGNKRKKWDGWGRMCVSGGGEEKKKKDRGGTWVVGKKEMGSGVYMYGGKKGGVEKKEEKKNWKEKIKLVLFVCSLCLVQSIELWKFI